MNRFLLKMVARVRRLPECALLGVLSADEVRHALDVGCELGASAELDGAIASRRDRGLAGAAGVELSRVYRQCDVQVAASGEDGGVREACRHSCDDAVVESVERHVGIVCRTRVTYLSPGASLPRHVDDPRQRRVIVPLGGAGTFSFVPPAKTAVLPMSTGELWFVNTAFEHEVTNEGRETRVALIADVVEVDAFDSRLRAMRTTGFSA